MSMLRINLTYNMTFGFVDLNSSVISLFDFNKKIDDSIAEMEKSATEIINFFRK